MRVPTPRLPRFGQLALAGLVLAGLTALARPAAAQDADSSPAALYARAQAKEQAARAAAPPAVQDLRGAATA
jgi:hypothetical protein